MFRESVVRIAFGASDVKGAISLHRVLLQSLSVRGGESEEEKEATTGGKKDPFGISDPVGMQTSTSPSDANSLNECLSSPFLPVYLLSRRDPLTTVSFRFFRKIYRRALTSP